MADRLPRRHRASARWEANFSPQVIWSGWTVAFIRPDLRRRLSRTWWWLTPTAEQLLTSIIHRVVKINRLEPARDQRTQRSLREAITRAL
ncbi:hypothetical protein [Gimesia aquarii]|uniref:hypothetical protein n=1 Tax=Gimesia aquarii TaxID=2527964 RepID=UPI00119CA3C9|nr:hypothetical protein [Gimesia aquarii]